MVLDDVQSWLEKTINFEKIPSSAKFSLKTMQSLVAMHANPQNAYNSIHVAGSKGKGSVCQFIASILKNAGYSEGVYASPHISSFAERVRKTDKPLDDSAYTLSFADLQKKHTYEEATWFEFVTLFAFLSFKYAKVNWAVFETGLGGRLDATNVLQPKLCIITPIELEHTEILGDTVEDIAQEKAGIFKPGIPVCSAKQNPKVRAVLEERANILNCPIYFVDDFYSCISYTILESKMPVSLIPFDSNIFIQDRIDAELSMIGSVQAENAALAVLAVKVLSYYYDIAVSKNQLIQALSSAKLLGRYSIYPNMYTNLDNTSIILDGAHTEKSIINVLNTYKEQFSVKRTNTHLLFACAADKDVYAMAKILTSDKELFSSVTLTVPGSFKQGNLDTTYKAFKKVCMECSITENSMNSLLHCKQDYNEAIDSAIKNAATENANLLVVGSFYLVGEVCSYLAAKAST